MASTSLVNGTDGRQWIYTGMPVVVALLAAGGYMNHPDIVGVEVLWGVVAASIVASALAYAIGAVGTLAPLTAIGWGFVVGLTVSLSLATFLSEISPPPPLHFHAQMALVSSQIFYIFTATFDLGRNMKEAWISVVLPKERVIRRFSWMALGVTAAMLALPSLAYLAR